jgi:spore maturation protein CgeB
MTPTPLNIVIFGLSISSSWGNGHATVYRALMRALCDRGHNVLFLERDVPWYAAHRDLPHAPSGRLRLYQSVEELKSKYAWEVANADLCMVGSYVPEGCVVADWVTQTAKGITAFYDIDTPITLAKLAAGDTEYISADLIPRFDLYLSFSGGPSLRLIERKYGSPRARPFYCSVDLSLYYPEAMTYQWDMGYMGTYSADRQASLEKLLFAPARHQKPARAIVGRTAVSAGSELARERRARRAHRARQASRLLQLAKVHAEPHACRHDRRRLLAECSSLRSGGVRDAHHQ